MIDATHHGTTPVFISHTLPAGVHLRLTDNCQLSRFHACVQLGEALSIAGGFSPSVLSSMPAVFTAGVAGPLQAFLSQGTPRHHALAEDRETCSMILADYAPDQPYRKTYLAFRAALEAEATAAAAWLHEDQQQVMLDKLRVLSEFKQRLEEQR